MKNVEKIFKMAVFALALAFLVTAVIGAIFNPLHLISTVVFYQVTKSLYKEWILTL